MMADGMKDSGIEWIGKIPKEWIIAKTLYGLKMPVTDGPHETPELYDDGIPFVSAEAVSSGKIDFKHIRGFISKDFYKECCKKYVPYKNDIYMVKSGATTGRVAIVDTDIIFTIWSPLAVFRVRDDIIFYRYLYYFLQSESYQKQVMINWTFGTQQNIGMRVLEKILICYPTLNEQRRISSFLDSECSKIDSIISNLEKQIETLTAYKKSLITETVTKGLDKTVLMKDSGVEWIGKIPEEWHIEKVKHIAKLNGRIGWQGLTSDEYSDEGAYLVTGTDFSNGVINWNSCVHVSIGRWEEAPDIQLEDGDLLITKDGTVGKLALAKNLPSEATLNSGVLLIRTNSLCDKHYLFWVLSSEIFWKWFGYVNAGNSTIIHLYQHVFSNFTFPLPSIKEQILMASFLDSQCSKIDSILADKQKALETMQAYKKSLIYEYVTGKKRLVG
jgi:type I restriction enzyme S subunit